MKSKGGQNPSSPPLIFVPSEGGLLKAAMVYNSNNAYATGSKNSNEGQQENGNGTTAAGSTDLLSKSPARAATVDDTSPRSKKKKP